MVIFIYIFILFLLSLDSLAAGSALALRKIKFPLSSMLAVFITSVFLFFISSLLGSEILSLFPLYVADIISSLIFIVMGVFIFLESIIENIKKDKISLTLKPLNIIITIMKTPESADIDNSKVIDIPEAIYIATALLVDAMFVSSSLSVTTPFYLVTLFGSVFQTLLLIVGLKIGEKLSLCKYNFSFLSGLILITLGILHLI